MFKGIITPIVTPFNRDASQSINYAATEKLINHLISAGVSGIFAMGSNGEFHVLTHEEKVDFAKNVVKIVNHRVPVFAGTGACSTKEAISLSCEMQNVGVDALSVINPYFIKPNDEELYGHFKEIAKSVDIPVILYNIPRNTGYNIPIPVVKRLAEIDNIVGIKDSSGDMELLKQYQTIANNNKFQVLIGSDSKIYPAYKEGVRAAIAGTSNLIPDILVSLDRALNDREDKKAQDFQKKIEVLRAAIKLGTIPSILKRAVELANIAEVGPARKPVNETNKQIDAKIIEMLKFYKIIN